MGRKAGDLTRRHLPLSAPLLGSWGVGGGDDPFAHSKARPPRRPRAGGRAFWALQCAQGSEWNPGSLPSNKCSSRKRSVYLVKAMASRCPAGWGRGGGGAGSRRCSGAHLSVTDGKE